MPPFRESAQEQGSRPALGHVGERSPSQRPGSSELLSVRKLQWVLDEFSFSGEVGSR